jgi:hypothetical protein
MGAYAAELLPQSRPALTEQRAERSPGIVVAAFGQDDVRGVYRPDQRDAHRLTERLPSGSCGRSGEPAGTAGVPMLQVLTTGIKLGAGGLVRAYGRWVSEALDAIGTLDLVPHTVVAVTVDHHAPGGWSTTCAPPATTSPPPNTRST